jgi:myo-inositol-1(or 4)-monophosphatase
VTEADMAVDTYLRETLTEARPDYGWLSEETADDPVRRERGRVFVVDPIDGTRGFIAGDRRWCVSLALVEAGRPTAGVLYAPALDTLYWGAVGEGAFSDRGPIRVSGCGAMADARLAGARNWLRDPGFGPYGAHVEAHIPSLAYRIALVADGRIDAAFASPRAADWDLAAADLLVHEAGGRLTGLDGAAPRYNRETLTHGVLGAANGALQDELLSVLRTVAENRAAGRPATDAR